MKASLAIVVSLLVWAASPAGARADLLLQADFCSNNYNASDPLQAGWAGWNSYPYPSWAESPFRGIGYEVGDLTRYLPDTPDLDIRVLSDVGAIFGFGDGFVPPGGFTVDGVVRKAIYDGTGFTLQIDGDAILPDTSYRITLYALTASHGNTDSVFADANGSFVGSVVCDTTPDTDDDVRVTGLFVADSSGVITINVSKGPTANYATASGLEISTVTIVPEPGAVALLGLGAFMVRVGRRRG